MGASSEKVEFPGSQGSLLVARLDHPDGGAAVLAAAGGAPKAKAIATIGAPSDAEHVVQGFAAQLAKIESEGEAEVQLAGRRFRIRRQLLEDLRSQSLSDHIARLRKALIVFHAPHDGTVGIENAAAIFAAARHPKSFVSLDNADQLLSSPRDATYVAEVLASWASRYIDRDNSITRAIGLRLAPVDQPPASCRRAQVPAFGPSTAIRRCPRKSGRAGRLRKRQQLRSAFTIIAKEARRWKTQR